MSDRIGYPKPERRDHVRAMVQASVSGVPVIGGPGADLLSFYLPASIERRRDRWFELLDERLADVEQVVLQEEAFQTVVLAATKAALGTHLEAKLNVLAQCLKSAAAPSRGADTLTAMRFLQHVDALEPEHLAILQRLTEPLGRASGETPRHRANWAWQLTMGMELDPAPTQDWVAAMAVNSWRLHPDAPATLPDLARRGLIRVRLDTTRPLSQPSVVGRIRRAIATQYSALPLFLVVEVTDEGRELLDFVRVMDDQPEDTPAVT